MGERQRQRKVGVARDEGVQWVGTADRHKKYSSC